MRSSEPTTCYSPSFFPSKMYCYVWGKGGEANMQCYKVWSEGRGFIAEQFVNDDDDDDDAVGFLLKGLLFVWIAVKILILLSVYLLHNC